MGYDEEMLAGDGMRKLKAFGAEELVGDPETLGIGDACVTSVLGITQDREAPVGTVDSQLVGASCNGTQFKFT